MQASRLDQANARLLVERGTRAVAGGYVWSSDPRLTRPAPTRLAEPQVQALLAAIPCPVRFLGAEPAQSYFPEAVRDARLAVVPDATVAVIAGSHHLHMDQPATVASFFLDFLAG